MSRRYAASRRNLLTGSAAMLVTATPAGGLAQAAGLDSTLLALLNDGRAALAAWQDALATTFAAHVGPRPWDAPLTAAAHLPARTPEGLRAKAETAADWLALGDRRSGLPHWCRSGEEQVAWSLLRDLLPELPAARPSPAPTMPAATVNPDAALLEACRLFPAAVAAVNDPTAGNLDNDDPAWVEYSRLCRFIGETDPHTMEGWVAKAHAAKVEALSINGEESPRGSCAEEWAWDLMNDMLRIRAGGGA